jgi:hypothetical protein
MKGRELNQVGQQLQKESRQVDLEITMPRAILLGRAVPAANICGRQFVTNLGIDDACQGSGFGGRPVGGGALPSDRTGAEVSGLTGRVANALPARARPARSVEDAQNLDDAPTDPAGNDV